MADSPLFISLFGFAPAKSIHIIWGGGLCPRRCEMRKMAFVALLVAATGVD